MDREEIKAVVENILLSSDEPVKAERLLETVQNGLSLALFQDVICELQEDYKSRNLQIVEVAEGFMLTTRREYSDWIKKFFRLDKQPKLSQPALDTLSIIAYKQPLTRSEVEEIRGVDSSGVIKTLLEKNVIALAGRKAVAGRPMTFKTTRKFLDYFGLKDLTDLPTLQDLQEADIVGDRFDASHMQTKMIFEDPSVDKNQKLVEIVTSTQEISRPDKMQEEPSASNAKKEIAGSISKNLKEN